ncbi:MAG: carbohydrate kinase family protein [Ignisphaera sp.]|nr:carbohydrate kinase family protein [Candidatus Geocrenenecus dongiae]
MDDEYDIAVVGDINLDLILPVRNFPSRGSMEYAREMIKNHGGVGRNIAIALSKLGLRTVLIGAVGDDESGTELIRELKDNRVNVSRVRVIKHMCTGTILVIVDEEGERTMIGHRGANTKLKIEEEDISIIEKTKHLHLSGYTLLNDDIWESINMLMRRVRSLKTKTSIDIEGVAEHKPTLLEEMKGFFNYVMAGENEARRFTGEEDPETIGLTLLEKMKAEIIALKMGHRGCIIATRERIFHTPSFKVTVVDTTGAGDAFNAGFIYGMARNLDLKKVAILANAMGAYKCMWFGTKNFPSLRNLIDAFPELGELAIL